MGICSDRYILVKISRKNGELLNSFYHNYDDVETLCYPAKQITEIIAGDSDYIITKSGLSFDYAIFSFRKRAFGSNNLSSCRSFSEIYLLIDTWDMYCISDILPTNNIIWFSTGLSKGEYDNLVDNIKAINYGLIDDVVVLESMLKNPTENWINSYSNNLKNIL